MIKAGPLPKKTKPAKKRKLVAPPKPKAGQGIAMTKTVVEDVMYPSDGVALQSVAMDDATLAKMVDGMTKSGAMEAVLLPTPLCFALRCPPELAARIDREWHKRGLRSRHATVLAILDEGAPK